MVRCGNDAVWRVGEDSGTKVDRGDHQPGRQCGEGMKAARHKAGQVFIAGPVPIRCLRSLVCQRPDCQRDDCGAGDYRDQHLRQGGASAPSRQPLRRNADERQPEPCHVDENPDLTDHDRFGQGESNNQWPSKRRLRSITRDQQYGEGCDQRKADVGHCLQSFGLK